MGQLTNTKIIIVTLCLLLTSFVMQRLGTSDTVQQEKKVSLADALVSMGSWYIDGDILLDQKVVDALELDDFLFRNFTNGSDTLSLYIGYYTSSKKVGAAHDPLVCFPGQGWVLSDVRQNVLPVKLTDKETEVSYSTMIAERNGNRKLLVYWFQAYDQATPGTLSQKIALMRTKIMGGGEDNAFVRISISLQGKTDEDARHIIFSFVNDFYPVFIHYILDPYLQGE